MSTTERPKSFLPLPVRTGKKAEQPASDEHEDDRDTWLRFLEERRASSAQAGDPIEDAVPDADSEPPSTQDSKRVARGSIPPPDKVEAQIIAEEEEVLKRYFDFAAEINRDTDFDE